MCLIKAILICGILILCIEIVPLAEANLMSMLDFRYFRCVMKREWKCPDSEINFFLYTPERPFKQWVDVRHKDLLDIYGWKPTRKNVLIIHGFNGTHDKTPMSFIRDAYLSRKDYNVFMVDWSPLTRFPCYLSSLSNMKLASQCAAQLYSYITRAGALAKMITCVGHSLGAHICGMISNHLTEKQYKIVEIDHEEDITWLKNNVDPWNTVEQKWAETSDYRLKHIYDGSSIIEYFNKYPALKQPNGYTLLLSDFNRMHPGKETCLFSMLELKHTQIISYAKNKAGHARDKNIKTAIQDLIGLIDGLDPARPLVSGYGSRLFRLGRDDAYVVQVIHTNAGFLGETGLVGHADFCVNGGKLQPGCKGHFMRVARCSHFMSSCYFAASVRRRVRMVGVPCDSTCPKERGRWGIRHDRSAVQIGENTPETSRGMYCVRLDHEESCPFD